MGYSLEKQGRARFERIPTKIYSNASLASIAVAKEISDLIRQRQEDGKHVVLGLATGSTPIKVYKELIRLHKEEGLSFSNVYSFNLDEYYPMQPDSIHSYVRFMEEQLFNHVDIPKGNYNIPNGTLPQEDIAAFCAEYEQKIEDLGGIDFQLLGIGGNGHIGFNEPGSLQNSKTRLITLDHVTRAAAAGEFQGIQKVPRKAITAGVSTIMKAERIVLMGLGEGKSKIVAAAVEGPITDQVPASYLQLHSNTMFVIDEPCSSELTKIKTPWAVDSVVWDNAMTKKAVCHLALTLGKSILKLTNKDYNDNGMGDLLSKYGHAHDLNIDVFNKLQHTITGWPGGKPNADDATRPERAQPSSKRVIIFSPHPDDDIISMGGTFQRLHDQGHDVHVGYQTSGNIAVADDEALRFTEFVVNFNSKFGFDNENACKVFNEISSFLKKKKASQIDTNELRQIKGMMRVGEAKATCRFVGIPDQNAHFMNLPFYETGAVQKNPPTDKDIQITMDLIKEIKPHQIFAAGDLADPHGTHKVCLDVIFEALKRLKDDPSNADWIGDCWLWLYRGAWAEWDIHEIEMAVPMSPEQILIKRLGIWKHQSQKDGVVFQGQDAREFWQRAEERNSGTAQLYNQLGLADYAAMEAFVRWHY
ncbi:glucosamine-6-phosphate deaminase [Solitalea sp. MAHUQ-68]|uniref:Glucosamine-6-phosphate deaminase n=1 Tax=Solitalea agri TaxID=2953739 RepID=A0A9X2FAD9_9SPHI|nr:glucosamine-6-phosphate deaminase [Solitalea agri]MCO4293308.1 glucosamine-6-phosphate deaminase [Solitalea agri]